MFQDLEGHLHSWESVEIVGCVFSSHRCVSASTVQGFRPRVPQMVPGDGRSQIRELATFHPAPFSELPGI